MSTKMNWWVAHWFDTFDTIIPNGRVWLIFADNARTVNLIYIQPIYNNDNQH